MLKWHLKFYSTHTWNRCKISKNKNSKISNEIWAKSIQNVCAAAIREAPLIRKKLTDLTVPAGQRATFEVEISGEPEPQVTWYRDETKIVSSKDFQITKC